MNIESIRDYCLSLPSTDEHFPFDETTLVFRVAGKIFASVALDNPDWLVVKCDAEYTIELREKYSEIEGAWHWNKKYWNQVRLTGTLSDDMIVSLINHSYEQVVKKLPKRVRDGL